MRHFSLQEALVYGKGVERPFLCPVHGDSRPSASLNVVKQVWFCYSCGAHGKLTGEDALLEPDYEQMRIWFLEKMEESRVYSERWLDRWDAAGVHPYWDERVGSEAARRFRLGSDPDRNAVTYPLRRPDGAVLGVVRRNLSDDGPKYLYPKGVDVGRLLFNYDGDRRSVVVLVEGALDAIALWNVGVTAFAIYGAVLGPEQIKLIDRVDPEVIVTAYDQDTAGWRAHYETERIFKHRLVERLTWRKGLGKDVDELGQENLKKSLTDLACADMLWVGSSSWRSSAAKTSTPGMRLLRSTALPRPRLTVLRSA
jgi:DNA primase